MSTLDPRDEPRELARPVRFDRDDVCAFGVHALDDDIAHPHPTGLRDAADLFASPPAASARFTTGSTAAMAPASPSPSRRSRREADWTPRLRIPDASRDQHASRCITMAMAASARGQRPTATPAAGVLRLVAAVPKVVVMPPRTVRGRAQHGGEPRRLLVGQPRHGPEQPAAMGPRPDAARAHRCTRERRRPRPPNCARRRPHLLHRRTAQGSAVQHPGRASDTAAAARDMDDVCGEERPRAGAASARSRPGGPERSGCTWRAPARRASRPPGDLEGLRPRAGRVRRRPLPAVVGGSAPALTFGRASSRRIAPGSERASLRKMRRRPVHRSGRLPENR